MFKFGLGSKVRNAITGYTGIVVQRTDYLSGYKRYGIQSQELYDGKPLEPEYFDEEQLKIIE